MRFFLTFALFATILALALSAPLEKVTNVQEAETFIFQKGFGNSADTTVGVSRVQVAGGAVGDVVDLGGKGGGVTKILHTISG